MRIAEGRQADAADEPRTSIRTRSPSIERRRRDMFFFFFYNTCWHASMPLLERTGTGVAAFLILLKRKDDCGEPYLLGHAATTNKE